MNHTSVFFDDMFAKSPDPWEFESRWYEKRKRDITLACLPKQRYASAYEPGCANGVLTQALAERCDLLIASDGSPKAVDLARQRLIDHTHVEVRDAWVPQEWPVGSFDLIVISELGYFLSDEDLTGLAVKVRDSLLPGGTVVSCHWRWKSTDCDFNGEDVHRRLAQTLRLPSLVHLEDRDFLLDVWSVDPRSVAQVEGLF
jgi:SAM-dependent methyltransferase